MPVSNPKGEAVPACGLPYATYTLILANVCVYLLTLSAGRDALISSLGLTPSRPSLASFFTYALLHTDILHLAGNMILLWLFGRRVEQALGHLGFVIAYLAGGAVAAMMHMAVIRAFAPDAAGYPLVGASGAIAGILGIFTVRFYRTTILRIGHCEVPAAVALGIWFVQQLVGAVGSSLGVQSGGVAYWSHIGGMIFGMLLAHLFRLGTVGCREYLMADACASLDRGHHLDAVKDLCAVLEHDPDNHEVHGRLGELHALQQDQERAVSHYLKSIDLCLHKGDCEQAVAGYAELRHYYPDVSPGLTAEYQIARYLIDTGCFGPGLKLLDGISTRYPATPEAEVSLMRAGELCMSAMGDPRRAIEYYVRFLHEYPHSALRAMVEKSIGDAKSMLGAAAGGG